MPSDFPYGLERCRQVKQILERWILQHPRELWTAHMYSNFERCATTGLKQSSVELEQGRLVISMHLVHACTLDPPILIELCILGLSHSCSLCISAI